MVYDDVKHVFLSFLSIFVSCFLYIVCLFIFYVHIQHDDFYGEIDGDYPGVDENSGLLSGAGNEGGLETGSAVANPVSFKGEKRKVKKKDDLDEAMEMINSMKDLMGIGNIPEDGDWVNLLYHDYDTGETDNMGQLLVSIQIVPEEDAKAVPVGEARDAPNIEPYLPPPVGRLKLSANPIMMLKALVGPKQCAIIVCCCCCVGWCVFLGLYGNLFITLFLS
jgi:hypothetical protein